MTACATRRTDGIRTRISPQGRPNRLVHGSYPRRSNVPHASLRTIPTSHHRHLVSLWSRPSYGLRLSSKAIRTALCGAKGNRTLHSLLARETRHLGTCDPMCNLVKRLAWTDSTRLGALEPRMENHALPVVRTCGLESPPGCLFRYGYHATGRSGAGGTRNPSGITPDQPISSRCPHLESPYTKHTEYQVMRVSRNSPSDSLGGHQESNLEFSFTK